ncbi:MAG: nitronate monooxygenase [Coriobacteriaceae bacterium]|jgi:enoyl-[acyl-carrier protein] reductase II|nr:nitronate monooxygenase [Coriobacteriaceae bacterium]
MARTGNKRVFAQYPASSFPFEKEQDMRTRVTELLGIEVPIIQGAMAWVADGRLAAAVSEAGGLGVIAAGSAPIAWVEEQIGIARSLTTKPLGVNVMLMSPQAAEVAALLARLRVEVVTTGAGSPSAFIEDWKAAGCKVVPVVASSALAKRMERAGADAVIAEGCEAGGHIGELTTMVLVPAVCEAVSIPVIAAGGIADGRGLLAAFTLGAEAVQMGTRFLTIEECGISDAYKERVLVAKDSDTVVTGRGSGHPVRGLKNAFARKARVLESDPSLDPDELESLYAGSLRRAVQGDVENGSLMAGQVACLVHERKDARHVIEGLMAKAQQLAACDLDALADANAFHGQAY